MQRTAEMAIRCMAAVALVWLEPVSSVVVLRGSDKVMDFSAFSLVEHRAISTVERKNEELWQGDLSAMLQSVQTLDKVVSMNGTAVTNAENAARLAPALAMLKGLLEDGKERIGKLNAREEESKKMFGQKKAEHEKRIADIDLRFHEGHLSEEFHTNETHDEERIWKYWDRVRARQHFQFKTALRIQRSTEQKVRTMITLYEDTLSGKHDKADIEKRLAKVTGGTAHNVLVLLEGPGVNEVRNFCKEEIHEIIGLQKDARSSEGISTVDSN